MKYIIHITKHDKDMGTSSWDLNARDEQHRDDLIAAIGEPEPDCDSDRISYSYTITTIEENKMKSNLTADQLADVIHNLEQHLFEEEQEHKTLTEEKEKLEDEIENADESDMTRTERKELIDTWLRNNDEDIRIGASFCITWRELYDDCGLEQEIGDSIIEEITSDGDDDWKDEIEYCRTRQERIEQIEELLEDKEQEFDALNAVLDDYRNAEPCVDDIAEKLQQTQEKFTELAKQLYTIQDELNNLKEQFFKQVDSVSEQNCELAVKIGEAQGVLRDLMERKNV